MHWQFKTFVCCYTNKKYTFARVYEITYLLKTPFRNLLQKPYSLDFDPESTKSKPFLNPKTPSESHVRVWHVKCFLLVDFFLLLMWDKH